LPNFISLKSDFSVHEYFPDATYSRQNKWEFNEQDEYPFVCFAHSDLPNKRLLKDMRLYINNTGKDDVFYKRVDNSYSYCYNLETAKYTWDESWERISNKWYQFCFGNEIDRTLLMLTHEQLKLSTSKFHPEKYWHTQENTRTGYL
jgi:hypothetical protein